MIRTTLTTFSVLLALALPAQAADDGIATPTLRASHPASVPSGRRCRRPCEW